MPGPVFKTGETIPQVTVPPASCGNCPPRWQRRSCAARNQARLNAPKDPDLAAVVDAWPDLPEALKAGIVAMVKATARVRS